MNWQPPTPYAQLSECGRYSVAKVGIGEGAWVYEAWRRRAHPDGPHMIATKITTAAAARKLCEADAEGEGE